MEILTFYCPAGCQAVTGNLVIIIGMHWQAQLHHNKVGNIYHIVDGTDAGTLQTLLHPFRRWTDFYILQHPSRETGAQVVSLNIYLQHILSLGCIVLVDLDFRPLWLVAGEDSYLTNQAKDTEAVTTVGSKLKLQDNIVQPQYLLGRNTYRGILWQYVNAIQLLWSHIGSIQLQLISRAQHAMGWHSTKLTLGNLLSVRQLGTYHSHWHNLSLTDILGTGNNLYRLLQSYIHGGDYHVVGVRMNHNLLNPAGNDLLQALISTDNILNRNTCHGQLVSQFLGGFLEIYIVMKPFYRYLHFIKPPS